MSKIFDFKEILLNTSFVIIQQMTKSNCREIWEMKLQYIEMVRKKTKSTELNRINPLVTATAITLMRNARFTPESILKLDITMKWNEPRKINMETSFSARSLTRRLIKVRRRNGGDRRPQQTESVEIRRHRRASKILESSDLI